MDSIPSSGRAPGAVDNGSGTVAVMLLAKIFAKYSHDRTIHFVAFGAEEQGLHGSAEYVRQAQANGDKVVAALTMDMIAYSNKYYGVLIEGTQNAAIQELMALVERNTKTYGGELSVMTTDKSFGSDHVSFQRAGIPAILAIERDDTNYPYYHQSSDTVKHVNKGQCTDIVKSLAATLVDLVGDERS